MSGQASGGGSSSSSSPPAENRAVNFGADATPDEKIADEGANSGPPGRNMNSRVSLESTATRWKNTGKQQHERISEVLTDRHKAGARGTRRERFAYLIDSMLSKRWSQCVALVCFGALQVAIWGMIYSAVWRYEDGDDPRDEDSINRFTEGIWEAWTFMADPGTHSKVYWPEQRVVAAFIAVVGIIFFASILGVIVDVIREKMESLRQGRSKVIENGHTLILGWTDKTILLIEELCIANESEGGGVVVVLASERKEQMEIELKVQLPTSARLGTKVVFRNGSPLLMGDLEKVSAHNAKALVVLASGGDADRADADTLRCMLSLRSLRYGLSGHIVAEVRDVDNEPLVKLVGGSAVETIVSHDVLGRLMLMSARQPGLAKVYEALLGFDGDEFYMQEWPELIGLKFGEITARFPNAVPIGIRSEAQVLHMKAGVDRIIEPGDEIIVIAEDNDTYKPEAPVEIEVGRPPEWEAEERVAEDILFCGWRRDIRDILQHLDDIVVQGTKVRMMSHCVPVEERNAKLLEEGLDVNLLRNIQIIHESGNTSVRRKLEALPLESLFSCMIFADQLFEADTMHADSHSLATLLLIRDIQACRKGLPASANPMRSSERSIVEEDDEPMGGHGGKRLSEKPETAKDCPIICEILDPRTQKTIAGNKYVSLSSDFCQTNRLVAQIVAMISEERSVKHLLDELLGIAGCNIAVYPAKRYCAPSELCSFFTVSERARLFDEIVIGYQLNHSIDKTVLNPPEKEVERYWDHYDFAVLIGVAKKHTADEEAKHGSTMKAFSAKESRNNLRESAREMRESWTQTKFPGPGEGARWSANSDKGTGAAFGESGTGTDVNERLTATLNQVFLAERAAEVGALAGTNGEDMLGALLASCSSMNEPERTRFGQALDMMKHIVSSMSDRRVPPTHKATPTQERGATASCQDCCPASYMRAGM